MSRKWLLSVLAGVVMSLGGGLGVSSAQPLSTDASTEESTTDVAVASVTVDTAPESPRASVEAGTEVESPEAETTVAPTVSATLSPEDTDLGVTGPVEVAGEQAPVDEVDETLSDGGGEAPPPTGDTPPSSGELADPVDDLLDELPTEQLPEEVAGPVEDVAEVLAPPPAAAEEGSVQPHQPAAPAGEAAPTGPAQSPEAGDGGTSTRLNLDAVAARSATARTAPVAGDGVFAPEVAAPLLAAPSAPRPQLAIPIVDTTPTVPALLRLLAGLMVVGAGATWKTVNERLG